MGKRIERIFSKEILPKKEYLINNSATIILKNGLSYKGKIINFAEMAALEIKSCLTLKLKANVMHQIEIDQIHEIQIDKITNW